MSSTTVDRNDKGQFIKGQSGNPAGRPVGSKNKIVALKQGLELAIRENLSASEVKQIVKAMVYEAQNGNVSAAKLILDKVMSNATAGEDVDTGTGGITISIKNLTFDQAPKLVEGEIIDQNEDSDG